MNNEDDKYRYKLFLESTLKIMFQFFLNDSLRRGRWSNKEKFSRESLITCRAWHSTRPLTTSAGWYRPTLAQINLNLFFDLSSLWFYDFKLLADIPIPPTIEPHKAKSISIHLYTLYDKSLSSLIYDDFSYKYSLTGCWWWRGPSRGVWRGRCRGRGRGLWPGQSPGTRGSRLSDYRKLTMVPPSWCDFQITDWVHK